MVTLLLKTFSLENKNGFHPEMIRSKQRLNQESLNILSRFGVDKYQMQSVLNVPKVKMTGNTIIGPHKYKLIDAI